MSVQWNYIGLYTYTYTNTYFTSTQTGEPPETNTCSFPQGSHVADGTLPSSSSSFEILVMESVAAPYQQVQPHWFFCRRADDGTSWLPFSREDSDKLENTCKTGKCEFEVDMDTLSCTYTVYTGSFWCCFSAWLFSFHTVGVRGEEVVVAVDGERYDVHVKERKRYAVYWEQAPTEVRRCTWFYKGDKDTRFMPYPEDFSHSLEVFWF